jgi:hypothetical protein
MSLPKLAGFWLLPPQDSSQVLRVTLWIATAIHLDTHLVNSVPRSPPLFAIVVTDRGYLDYALYENWTQCGVYFVTRRRTNMLYEVIERRPVGTRRNVTCDETIKLADGYGRQRCPSLLRQVTVQDAEHQREVVFLTNIFHLAASTVGAIYKDRWQIELLFKALK